MKTALKVTIVLALVLLPRRSSKKPQAKATRQDSQIAN